jgi:NADP-dependent 3-hydroxy acid dehydrogenase YdfG
MARRKPEPLAGRTVVVTGAGSGIGRAVAKRMSAHGCPVAIVDVSAETLEETEAACGGPVLARVLDVRDRHAQMQFAADVDGWAPAPLGMVFNNAGVALSASVANGSDEDEAWLRAINFDGVVHGTRAFLPILQRQDSGTIVNTSSVFGLVGFPYQSAYCAAKFAVRGFTDSLRQELRGTGVRAANVHPGGVKTNIVRNGRILEDPQGFEVDLDSMARDFEAIAQTTPERAAEIIHDGVDAGKARILVGPDAYMFDALARIAPTRYYDVIALLERMIARRRGRARP